MSYSTACLCAFLLYCVLNNYQCLKVIPERAEVTYFNTSFFEDPPILNVRRYKRKGDYYINMIFNNKIDMSNTMTVDFIFYEYLHNEFRRSFPEMHFKFCDLINDDPYIGKTLRMAGLKTCPVQPGKHDVSNMTFNQFVPSVWPFEKGMLEIIITNTNDVVVVKGEVVVTFKLELPKFKA